jgi:hypothetical protein
MLDSVASRIDARGQRGPVREALQAALRERCKVYLEVPAQGVIALTQVEQITADEIVIAVPSIGGMTYPLAFGETLKISFVDQRLNRTGPTKCLGRVKVPAGGGKTLVAYRLALPDALTTEERRAAPRTDLGADLAPEAHLYSGKMPAPIVGLITNISVSGVRLTLPAAPPRSLAIGQELYLKFRMPDPIGVVDEVVEVQRIDFERRTGVHTVGVSFHSRIDRLAGLMRPGAATSSSPTSAAPPLSASSIAHAQPALHRKSA